MKICVRCKVERREIEFVVSKTGKGGIGSWCKPCYADYRRVREYGLTTKGYNKLLRKQRDKCAICLDKPATVLHIDHDHDTGKVRGLLCRECNLAVGKLGDDPNTIVRAVAYFVAHLTSV